VRIRTCAARISPKKTEEKKAQARLVARLIRDAILRDDFESLADLTDVVKHRCAQLGIRVTADDFTIAYRWLDTNCRLLTRGRWAKHARA
jgi:hypothetical protein